MSDDNQPTNEFDQLKSEAFLHGVRGMRIQELEVPQEILDELDKFWEQLHGEDDS